MVPRIGFLLVAGAAFLAGCNTGPTPEELDATIQAAVKTAVPDAPTSTPDLPATIAAGVQAAQAAAARSPRSAAITGVRCESVAIEDGDNVFALVASGTARVQESEGIYPAYIPLPDAGAGPGIGFPTLIGPTWTGARPAFGFSKLRQTGEPEEAVWTVNARLSPGGANDVEVRILIHGANAKGLIDGHLTSTTVTCKAVRPTVKVTRLACIEQPLEAGGRSYKVEVEGTAAAPLDARLQVFAGTQGDGAFALSGLKGSWEVIGFPNAIGFQRTDGKPIEGTWSYTAQSGPLDGPARTVMATLGLYSEEGTPITATRAEVNCEPIDVGKPVREPTQALEGITEPARDINATWRGGINSIGFVGGQRYCQWAGSLRLVLTQNGTNLGGRATVEWHTSKQLHAFANCNRPAQEQYDVVGTVSGTSLRFIFQGQGVEDGTAFAGSFTTDLMSGTFETTGPDRVGGCFQATRLSIGAVSDCRNPFAA